MGEPALTLVKADSTLPLKLDLACGETPHEGFEGVDFYAPSAKHKVDLTVYPWPWNDNSVEEIFCSHYCEHVPMEYVQHGDRKKDALCAFFDECYRILKPGAMMKVIVPNARSNRAFQDPTHRRFFVAESFLYFNREWRDINKLGHYLADCNFGINVNHTMLTEMTLLHPEVQARRFNESWNVIFDWVADLKSLKPEK